MYKDINNIHGNTSLGLRKISMLVLAILPLLTWYALPLPTGLGTTIVLFLSIYTIMNKNFKINVVPNSFWIVFTYVCIMWVYHNNFAIWTILPPGGWVFFAFFLALIWGILSFDLNLLKKYMFRVVIISAFLFWVQFILKLVYGHNIICLVPNLTGSLNYEDMSYMELVGKQLSEDRPCSIFMEPSHMAYYYISYLAVAWFGDNFKEKWFNKESFFIMLTVIALKSGSGVVGLAILFLIKFFKFYGNSNFRRKLKIVIFIIPVAAISLYCFSQSKFGSEIFSRSEEFSTEGTSGYARIISGYIMFEQLGSKQKLIGIGDPREVFVSVRIDGTEHLYANCLQMVLLSLGYIGVMIYLYFYYRIFRKVNLTSRICLIVLMLLSLIDSCYLNSYMMLLTIIPCADYYHKKQTEKINESSIYHHPVLR